MAENTTDSKVTNSSAELSSHIIIPNEECLLDVYTPKTLISKFEALDDCTAEIIGLIKSVATKNSKLEKVAEIFCAVENCNTNEIVMLTKDKNRIVRFASTYLAFSKIKKWCREKKSFDTLEKLYDNVFLCRFKDVYPAIRSLCTDFMGDWVISLPRIFNTQVYLKYIGWSLNDKNDGVRRKGVQVCSRFVRNKQDFSEFFANYRSRLEEMVLHDRALSVREECKKMWLNGYLKGLFEKNVIYKIIKDSKENNVTGKREGMRRLLSTKKARVSIDKDTGLNEHGADNLRSDKSKQNVDSNASLMSSGRSVSIDNDNVSTGKNAFSTKAVAIDVLVTKAVLKLLDDGRTNSSFSADNPLKNVYALHDLHSQTNARALTYLEIGNEHLSEFLYFVTSFIQKESVCCDGENVCYVEMLQHFKITHVDIKLLYDLLETVKDSLTNVVNVVLFLKVLQDDCFIEQYESTKQIVHRLHDVIQHNCNDTLFQRFVELLKMLSDSFPSLTNEIIDYYKTKEEYLLQLIMVFDVSDVVNADSKTIVKCYSALWCVLREDYDFINTVRLDDVDRIDVLVDFLILFKQKADEFKSKEAIAMDTGSAFRVLYKKLYILMIGNVELLACSTPFSNLIKLVNYGIFSEHAYLIFKFTEDEVLIEAIERCEHKNAYVAGFFKFLLQNNETVSSNVVRCIIHASRRCEDLFVYKQIKSLINEKEHLLDTLLVGFVPVLKINECIALENLCSNSKFKKALLKRIKMSNKNLSKLNGSTNLLNTPPHIEKDISGVKGELANIDSGTNTKNISISKNENELNTTILD